MTLILQKINLVLIISLLLAGFMGITTFSPGVSAQTPEDDLCTNIQGGTYDPATGTCDETADGRSLTDIFKIITNTLLFLVGAVSVIMLIIGGFKYTVSGGDANAVTSAKNTILYAIVGILVAFLAFAAVNFVINRL